MYRYLILISFFFSCQLEKSEVPFDLLSSIETGINFTNNLIESDSSNIIQYLYFYNGSGVGVADFNNDGYTDIVFSSNQGHPELYLNGADNTISFENVSEVSGLSQIEGWGTGVSIVDINDDGLMDMYLCQVGNYKTFKGRNRLMVNKGLDSNGIPKFTDETINYGLDYSGFSTQAAFLDYDLDGDLDMYLLNHSVHNTSNYGSSSLRLVNDKQVGDRFYENKEGKFINVTSSAGIYSSKIGYGLGIVVSDFDNNGYPDIYIGNDFHEHDYLYLNNTDKTFSESIEMSTSHNSQFSMGVDAADINDDGWVDILSLDMRPEDEIIQQSTVSHDANSIFNFKHSLGYHYQYPHNQLQLHQGLDNNKAPIFVEIAQLLGIDATDWSWSALIEDYNNDGHKDIFISNGIIKRPNDLDYLNYIADEEVQRSESDLDFVSHMPSGLSSNYFFISQNSLQFYKSQDALNIASSTGAACADFDNDGDIDIVTNNINTQAFIYENNSSNNYVQLDLKDPLSNIKAIGAKIKLFIDDKILYRTINPYRGFMSSSDCIQSIGLGNYNKIDSIQIVWPDLKQQSIYNPEINTRLQVVKSIRTTKIDLTNSDQALLKKDINTVFTDNEDVFVKNINNLGLQHYLQEGPKVTVGDFNNDGAKDIFISNSASKPSPLIEINVNDDTYSFDKLDSLKGKDLGAGSIFDYNGDGYSDLVVAESSTNSPLYMPKLRFYRIIENDSLYIDSMYTRPLNFQHASCIRPCDYDEDGDLDIFMGNRTGLINSDGGAFVKHSSLLVNDNSGFTDFGNNDLLNLGNVTDAAWADVDNDGDNDLVVISEWAPINLLINKENGFSKRTISNSEGLWRSVKLVDIDGDGDKDIIAGNIGLNNLMNIDTKSPLVLNELSNSLAGADKYLISYANNGLLESTDDILKELPVFKKAFSSYGDFARKDLTENFGKGIGAVGKAVTFETKIFINDGKANYSALALPIETQYSTVNAIIVDDLNADGKLDIILAGNEYSFTSSFGRKDSSIGLVLIQDDNLNFKALTPQESGLKIKGMVRDAVKFDEGKYLFAINNGPAVIYEINW